jgi:hypothetical protein
MAARKQQPVESKDVQEVFSRQTLWTIIGSIVGGVIFALSWVNSNIIKPLDDNSARIARLEQIKPSNSELNEKFLMVQADVQKLGDNLQSSDKKLDDLIKVVQEGRDEQKEAAKIYDSRFSAVLIELEKLQRKR